MARRRDLRPEEAEIWDAVARTARPLHPPRKKQPVEDPPQKQPNPPRSPQIPSFALGEKVRHQPIINLAPGLAEGLAKAPLQMDAKAHAKMTRGKLVPEARIDLHGLTLAQAHPELIRFILNAHGAGLRLVLVITGKGKSKPDHGPIPQMIGALRHQVPQWLRLPPLGPHVLQIEQAHLRHGGAGAYYVYLRRAR